MCFCNDQKENMKKENNTHPLLAFDPMCSPIMEGKRGIKIMKSWLWLQPQKMKEDIQLTTFCRILWTPEFQIQLGKHIMSPKICSHKTIFYQNPLKIPKSSIQKKNVCKQMKSFIKICKGSDLNNHTKGESCSRICSKYQRY